MSYTKLISHRSLSLHRKSAKINVNLSHSLTVNLPVSSIGRFGSLHTSPPWRQQRSSKALLNHRLHTRALHQRSSLCKMASIPFIDLQASAWSGAEGWHFRCSSGSKGWLRDAAGAATYEGSCRTNIRMKSPHHRQNQCLSNGIISYNYCNLPTGGWRSAIPLIGMNNRVGPR